MAINDEKEKISYPSGTNRKSAVSNAEYHGTVGERQDVVSTERGRI